MARCCQHRAWLAAEEHAKSYQGDAWDELIQAYLENEIQWLENGLGERNAYRHPRPTPLTDVSVGDIMERTLGIEKARWTQPDQNRVVRSLISLGFRRCRARKSQRLLSLACRRTGMLDPRVGNAARLERQADRAGARPGHPGRGAGHAGHALRPAVTAQGRVTDQPSAAVTSPSVAISSIGSPGDAVKPQAR